VNKSELQKRFESLVWRMGTMVAALVVSFLTENIGLFGLPMGVTIILGLVLGEVTKYLNTQK
jgi:hypothetical protein